MEKRRRKREQMKLLCSPFERIFNALANDQKGKEGARGEERRRIFR